MSRLANVKLHVSGCAKDAERVCQAHPYKGAKTGAREYWSWPFTDVEPQSACKLLNLATDPA